MNQKEFIDGIEKRVQKLLGKSFIPAKGQGKKDDNIKTNFKDRLIERREGQDQKEQFELGDLRFKNAGIEVVIEYDNYDVKLSNILKFWPYLSEDLDCDKPKKLIICHFSSWKSYGSRRQLANWLIGRMKKDFSKKISYRQFDHWKDKNGQDNPDKREVSIKEALKWIKEQLAIVGR